MSQFEYLKYQSHFFLLKLIVNQWHDSATLHYYWKILIIVFTIISVVDQRTLSSFPPELDKYDQGLKKEVLTEDKPWGPETKVQSPQEKLPQSF